MTIVLKEVLESEKSILRNLYSLYLHELSNFTSNLDLGEEEKILLVKSKGSDSSYYTLLGGAVEEGETLEDAAIREVKEETGLDVKLDGVFAISEAFFEERGHHAIFFFYW